MCFYMQDNFLPRFDLGWLITNIACLASYLIDTMRRRMMMRSIECLKYDGSLDAFQQIIKNEGVSSLLKGARANIVFATIGACVLAGYDELQKYWSPLHKFQRLRNFFFGFLAYYNFEDWSNTLSLNQCTSRTIFCFRIITLNHQIKFQHILIKKSNPPQCSHTHPYPY